MDFIDNDYGDIESQIRSEMLTNGVKPPGHINLDGKLTRFKNDSKSKSGWYVFFNDKIVAGAFGCWRKGVQKNFVQNMGRELNQLELQYLDKRKQDAKRLHEEYQRIVAFECQKKWMAAEEAPTNHPYLKDKNILSHGLRQNNNTLLLPVYIDNQITSLQQIYPDGSKYFYSGGKTRGGYFLIGAPSKNNVAYIVEGYATGASVYAAMGELVVVAFNAQNLLPVVANLRASDPLLKIIIVADNDSESGAGERYAKEAAEKYSAEYVLVPTPDMDANDYANAGGDLVALLTPQEKKFIYNLAEFQQKFNVALEYWIKGWLQKESLCVIFGASGTGKTYVVLDMCLTLASNKAEWCGNKVNQACVLYMCGEGHAGLNQRIMAWLQKNPDANIDPTFFNITHGFLSLDDAQGLQKTIEHIDKLPTKPTMVVVDTLSRFMAGDTNSDRDATVLTNNCSTLIDRYKATVVLMHHTGVAKDNQYRARGAGTFKNNAEIEMRICKAPGNSESIQIQQTKLKDGGLPQVAQFAFESVELKDVKDCDGEPVVSSVLVHEPVTEKQQLSDEQIIEAEKHKHISAIIEYWKGTGRNTKNGLPFIPRNLLKDFFIKKLEKDEKTASLMFNPSRENYPIGFCLKNGLIEKAKNEGFILINKDEFITMNLNI